MDDGPAGATDGALEDATEAAEDGGSDHEEDAGATLRELLAESVPELTGAGLDPPEVSPGPTQFEPVKPAGVVGLVSA